MRTNRWLLVAVVIAVSSLSSRHGRTLELAESKLRCRDVSIGWTYLKGESRVHDAVYLQDQSIMMHIVTKHGVISSAYENYREECLHTERVTAAIGRTGRPCRIDLANQLPMFTDT